MSRIGVPLVLAALALAPKLAGSEQVGIAPVQVTTDTAQYCKSLAVILDDHMHRIAQPPPAATELSVEGRRLCGIGMIRGGIARLRRAIVILENPDFAR